MRESLQIGCVAGEVNADLSLVYHFVLHYPVLASFSPGLLTSCKVWLILKHKSIITASIYVIFTNVLDIRLWLY